MLRRSHAAGLALAVLAAALLSLRAEEPKPVDKPVAPDDKTAKADAPTDILATVKEWNSDKFAAPPTQFRQGNATPRPVEVKATTATKNGFVIQLPSGAPIPTPTVYKDRLYVSGGFHSREYYCFDAESGKPVWGVNLDDDGPTSAACQDGVILFNTESCTIFALDAETGKQLWSLFLGDPLTNTPTIANGKVFTAYPCAAAGTGGKAPPPCSHVLAAFDLKTGKILWQRWIDSDVMSAPVAVDKELYVTSFAGTVYKLNQDDGTLLSAMRSRATSAPIVVADHIFLTRRADDGKGAVSETVASDARDSLREVASGAKKAAPYLDKTVQDRAAIKDQALKLDAGNGFAGGASGVGQSHGGLRQRRPVERVVDASVSGVTDLELPRFQLQHDGRRDGMQRPGDGQEALVGEAGRRSEEGGRLPGVASGGGGRPAVPDDAQGRGAAPGPDGRQGDGALRGGLPGALSAGRGGRQDLRRHGERQGGVPRRRRQEVHRLAVLGRQRGPHGVGDG